MIKNQKPKRQKQQLLCMIVIVIVAVMKCPAMTLAVVGLAAANR
jgi:hypothetical protein